MRSDFYTYAWLREDGSPYYIGKGTGNRAYRSHRRGDKQMSAPPRHRVLFLKKDITEFDAYKHEMYMVSHYGRKDEGGILINMTAGGEGTSGRKPTDYCIERTKETNTGRTFTAEQKKKVSEQVSKRKWWNNGVKDKHTIECPGEGWVLGRLHNTKSEVYKSKEFAEKSRQNMLGKPKSEEARAKMSAARKGRSWWNNGESTRLAYECPGEGWVKGRPAHLANCHTAP